MTTRKRCVHPGCLRFAGTRHRCDEHARARRIELALARKERKADARRQMILNAIALLASEGYEVRKLSVNERTMP